MPRPDVAIEIRDLLKEFHPPRGSAASVVRAVDRLSLSIEKGAFYGLLGPNGAGKTTTIRAVTGLARPTAGTVRLMGDDVVSGFRTARRRVGLAPQEFDFDQFLTARQVLTYRGMYFEMSRRKARARADELLETFQLAHKSDVRVHRLSGGQKRRLLIAKALMHDPEILILDEPTAGVDVALRRQLWEYLQAENERGKTILLTTHYIEEAEALCDRIGIIDQGRLVQEGTPTELTAGDDADQVVVRLAAPFTGDLKRLSKSAGHALHAMEDGLVLSASGATGGEMASGLLAALVKRRIRVENVEIRRQSLEDAFVRFTGTRLAETGEAEHVAKRGGNV